MESFRMGGFHRDCFGILRLEIRAPLRIVLAFIEVTDYLGKGSIDIAEIADVIRGVADMLATNDDVGSLLSKVRVVSH
jgi:hypothetical protein